MRVVIAGGHGKIAIRLERLLAEQGHQAVGLVRNPEHLDDLAAIGAKGVLCDLETTHPLDVAHHIAGANAVVFAAGAGPGSGAARKDTMDRGGSVTFAEAAGRADVRRLVQISSIGAGKEPGPGVDDVFAAYLRAKTAAEDDLRERDLDWTILRPGGLTDEPGTGLVRLEPPGLPHGSVPRDDVAAVVLALLETTGTERLTLDLTSGAVPVERAVAEMAIRA